MLVGAGSGALTQGEPDSKGVTKGAAQDTLMAQIAAVNFLKQRFQST